MGFGTRLLFFLLLLAPGALLYASCAGEENCDPCYDQQVPLTSSQKVCVIDGDCVLVADGCGGWLSVRSDRVKEVEEQITTVRPSCDAPVRTKCVFSTCRVKGRYTKNTAEECS